MPHQIRCLFRAALFRAALAGAALLAAAGAPGLALPGHPPATVPPALDTAALCERAIAVERSSTNRDECMAAEERAREYLRAAYPAVPARVRSRCEQLSRRRTGGLGSYAFIQGCLDLK